jgi:hypothetical protein
MILVAVIQQCSLLDPRASEDSEAITPRPPPLHPETLKEPVLDKYSILEGVSSVTGRCFLPVGIQRRLYVHRSLVLAHGQSEGQQ